MEQRQSLVSVIAKAKLGLYEQRILLMLVSVSQEDMLPLGRLSMHLEQLTHRYNIKEVTLNIADLLTTDAGGGKQYADVVRAAQELCNRRFCYKTPTGDEVTTKWVMRCTHRPKTGQLALLLDKCFFDTLYNFSKGWCSYDLNRAMSLRHPQSVRFYQLINHMSSEGFRASIDWLKDMFGVSEKYGRTNDFLRKVVDVAAQELQASGEGNYFVYKRIYSGNKITAIHITPVKRATSEEIQHSAGGVRQWLPLDYFRLLVQHGGFTTRELATKKLMWQELSQLPGGLGMQLLLDIMHRARKKGLDAGRTKAYIVGAVKAEMLDVGKRARKYSGATS